MLRYEPEPVHANINTNTDIQVFTLEWFGQVVDPFDQHVGVQSTPQQLILRIYFP